MRLAYSVFHSVISGILLFVLSGTLMASHSIGNGGDGVICENTQPIQSLDHYEGLKFGFLYQELDVNQDIKKSLDEIIKGRLFNVDQKRAELLLKFNKEFSLETHFFKSDINPVYDSGRIYELPKKCKLVQICVQSLKLEGNIRQKCSLKIFNRLDLRSKLFLRLHELVLREHMVSGVKNTEGVRFFTAAILADQNQLMSDESYEQLLLKSEFSSLSVDLELKNMSDFLLKHFNRKLFKDGNKLSKQISNIRSLASQLSFDLTTKVLHDEVNIRRSRWSVDKFTIQAIGDRLVVSVVPTINSHVYPVSGVRLGQAKFNQNRLYIDLKSPFIDPAQQNNLKTKQLFGEKLILNVNSSNMKIMNQEKSYQGSDNESSSVKVRLVKQ